VLNCCCSRRAIRSHRVAVAKLHHGVLRRTERAAEAKPPPEDWPICTTMTAGIGGRVGATRPGRRGAQEGAGRRGLESRDRGAQARRIARSAQRRYPELHRLCLSSAAPIGAGDAALSRGSIAQSPPPQRAHEHLGELYLVLREPAAAEQQLARLEDICLIPCAETDDLKRAIAVYKTLAAR
jgi:hypothetical protein